MAPNSGVQEYCLRWNNHHSTLVSVMDSLLQKGALVDVTLAAEGKSIQVHRLVLFACSHYFQELLSQHWDKQAVVFLKDVKFDQLQALVDYMYRGEVNVSQDQLAAFLSTAEALKIKGLADGDRERTPGGKRSQDKSCLSPLASAVNRLSKKSNSNSTATKLLKEEAVASTPASVVASPSTATSEKLPVLPSLVRIPNVTCNDSNEDSSPESFVDNNEPVGDHDMLDDDHQPLTIVEPKIEAETEEYSAGSADEEDWSDSEYHSRIETSQGDQTWNDDQSASLEHLAPGQSLMDDANNSARGFVDTWHVPEAASARSKSRKKVLPNQQGRYECHRCGRSYNLYGNLRRHWRYDCGDQPPQFACPLCGRLFRRRSNLRAHAARSNCHPLTTVKFENDLKPNLTAPLPSPQ